MKSRVKGQALSVIASPVQPGGAIHGLPRRLRAQAPCNDDSVNREPTRGFALIITLALLALLVLAVLALSALIKVNSQIASVSAYRTQARQNALLGLNLALGQLQQHAGPDAVVTGTGGVGGAAVSTRVRQWCGVWPADATGNPVWLVSGAANSASPAIDPARTPAVRLVGAGSVGTEGADKEFVEVGSEPILAPDEHEGVERPQGAYAYWIGDEGAKASAIILDAEVQTSPSGTALRPNFRRLLSGTFAPAALSNRNALTFEQLRFTAVGMSLVNAFHSLTRRCLALAATAPDGAPRPGSYVAGAFNVNTTSEAAWRAWLEFPDSNSSVWGLTAARTLSAARGIRDRITARARPFSSVAELAASDIIQEAFDHATPKIKVPTQAQFLAELAPILTVRSDTFRIRAYGEALNPADATKIEATATCEAIVQRTPDPAPNNLGRRFIVTYFRWLGPDDI